MIPATWIPHRRAEDNELLGYLSPVEGVADRFVPLTVFGHPLGDEGDEHDARQILDETGLSYIASRWSLTLGGRPEPISVEIVEASPERLRVRNVDYGYEGDIGDIFVVDVPPGDVLRRL
ncbi:hypothetical protein [Actinoplanes philippinensis]|uniref:hypothetical protein n=1 Tax=Actinoplanes philippinensis TaxID=35752 RepID=UPI0033E6E57A